MTLKLESTRKPGNQLENEFKFILRSMIIMPSFPGGNILKENILISNITNMNTKGTRLAAVLGLSSVVLATGVYAAKNETPIEGALNNQRPQMEMRQQFGSGEMLPPDLGTSKQMMGKEGIKKGGKGEGFVFAFIDEESLADAQKSEIERLQEERDEAIKKINDEFFDKLEKFISEEKLEDYENFVANHENMKGMKQGKGNHKMRGMNPTKDIQKPKTTTEEE